MSVPKTFADNYHTSSSSAEPIVKAESTNADTHSTTYQNLTASDDARLGNDRALAPRDKNIGQQDARILLLKAENTSLKKKLTVETRSLQHNLQLVEKFRALSKAQADYAHYLDQEDRRFSTEKKKHEKAIKKLEVENQNLKGSEDKLKEAMKRYESTIRKHENTILAQQATVKRHLAKIERQKRTIEQDEQTFDELDVESRSQQRKINAATAKILKQETEISKLKAEIAVNKLKIVGLTDQFVQKAEAESKLRYYQAAYREEKQKAERAQSRELLQEERAESLETRLQQSKRVGESLNNVAQKKLRRANARLQVVKKAAQHSPETYGQLWGKVTAVKLPGKQDNPRFVSGSAPVGSKRTLNNTPIQPGKRRCKAGSTTVADTSTESS